MDRRDFMKLTAVTSLGLVLPGSAALAEWKPRRPINVILPYSAGGGTDAFGRAVSSVADKVLPVPVVIVNKPGSSGITGATEAVRARPDGSTMMLTSAGSFLLTSMLRKTDVNPIDSFRIIGSVGKLTTSLIVKKDGKFKTLKDVIEFGKANPGELRWGHTGRGSYHHVAGQGFLNANGVQAVDVPFKGGGNTRAAVIGGQVDFIFAGIQQTAGFEDQVVALGLNDDERDKFKTDVPTFEELGYKYVPVTSPIVLYAPKDTSDEIVDTMSAALKKITELPEFAEIMAKQGNYPYYRSGAEVKTFLEKMKEGVGPILQGL